MSQNKPLEIASKGPSPYLRVSESKCRRYGGRNALHDRLLTYRWPPEALEISDTVTEACEGTPGMQRRWCF